MLASFQLELMSSPSFPARANINLKVGRDICSFI
jgi:hypothetical protein